MSLPERAPFLLVAAAVAGLDQLTKHLVVRLLRLHSDRVLVPGFLSLRHGRNPGVAFSILSDADFPHQAGLLAATSLVVAAGLVVYALRLPPRPVLPQLALAFIVGGAAGNLVDRLRLGFVVDFIHVYWGRHQWPDFNLADSAISVGVGLLILAWRRPGAHGR
jgi:signal peptidase II